MRARWSLSVETKMYQECLPFIKALAYQFSKKVPRPKRGVYDHSELLSVGNEVFVNALRQYDPRKCCKFTTFLWTCLQNVYRNIVNRSKIELAHESEAAFSAACQPHDETELQEHIIKQLSPRAAVVFVCLVQPPDELWQLALLEHGDRAQRKTRYTACKGMREVRVTKNLIAEHLDIHPMVVSHAVNEIKGVLQVENLRPYQL